MQSQCFPQFPNARSVVELGSMLTMKTRTVAILSRHAIPLRISGEKFEI
jgi:hypothetical protein